MFTLDNFRPGTKTIPDSRLVPSRYLCVWGERRFGVRLRRQRSHGKVRRKDSDWQISFVGDVQIVIEAFRSLFLKITALFCYFFCSISFVTFIYLLLTIKKLAKSIFIPFLAF